MNQSTMNHPLRNRLRARLIGHALSESDASYDVVEAAVDKALAERVDTTDSDHPILDWLRSAQFAKLLSFVLQIIALFQAEGISP